MRLIIHGVKPSFFGGGGLKTAHITYQIALGTAFEDLCTWPEYDPALWLFWLFQLLGQLFVSIFDAR